MKYFFILSILLIFIAPMDAFSNSSLVNTAISNSKKKKKETKKKKAKKKTDQIEESDTFIISFEDDTKLSAPNKKSTSLNHENKDTTTVSILNDTLKTSSPIISSNHDSLQMLIQEWLGTPHRIGGCSKSGIDCSCFAATIYKEIYGVKLNRSSSEMINDVDPIKSEELREGDLVFFKIRKNRISHVGVYLYDGNFVHSSTSKGVIISNLSEPYWRNSFYGGGRPKESINSSMK